MKKILRKINRFWFYISQLYIRRRLIRLMRNNYIIKVPYGYKVINIENIEHMDCFMVYIRPIEQPSKKEIKIQKLQKKLKIY